MAAIRTFDPEGVPVALGKELGRGGEGAVYDIQGVRIQSRRFTCNRPTLLTGKSL